MKKIFLFSGKMQSGKDTAVRFFSEMLEERKITYHHDLFAKGVKDTCKEVFNGLAIELNEWVENFLANYGDIDSKITQKVLKLKVSNENWYENKTFITRCLLQILGTEIFRNKVNEDYWTNQLLERCDHSDKEVILISDLRFRNEADIFSKFSYPNNLWANSFLIRINRKISNFSSLNYHQSEIDLDNYPHFNYIIENDGSLNDLYNKVKNILIPLVK